MLGYYPPTHPRDGRFHKIEVRVKRPGLRVEARKGYASPRGRTPEERKRDEEARRRPRRAASRRKKNVDAAARRADESDSSERSDVHGAGGAVQEHRERGSIALAIEIDGGRSATASRMRREWSPTRSSCRFSASTHGQGDRAGLDRARSDASARNARARHRVRRAREPAHQPASGAYQIRLARANRWAARRVRCSTTSRCPTSARRSSCWAGC